jgi:phosphopantothenoylcysteine decarboxylase/phosphopantothenate--cysteine ligase
LVRFKFFDELRSRLNNELRAKIYDIIIHNAAVSDFKLKKIIKGKLASGRSYTLKLSPLPKVVKEIRAQNPKARLVIFKLEPGVLDKVLMQRAKSALRKFKADTVVANRVNPYRAFIIDSRNKIVTARNKTQLADRLLGVL